MTFRGHATQDGPDDLSLDARLQLGIHQRARRERAHATRVRPAVAVARSAAEHRAPLRHAGEHHDGRGDRRRYRADEDVTVLDVRQLVGNDAFELALRQELHDAFGRGHRGVARISAGRERVGRHVRDHVDPRHGQAGLLREPGGHAVQRVPLADLGRAVHPEHQLV